MLVKPRRFPARLFLVIAMVGAALGGYLVYRRYLIGGARTAYVRSWLINPADHPDWAVRAGERCLHAPFIIPTGGLVGYLWDDSFRPGHRHQGIDIFGGSDINQTTVVAAYPGYLTRLADWKSAVIIRIPDDPLRPSRQIWTYYTHMADSQGNSFIAPEFPPGTSEVFVEAGTLLGYQGNYSGDPNNPVGVHLHFSIVLDDGQGHFRNELEIKNTLDPTPYLGLDVNGSVNQGEVPVCKK
jgi:peptidoglycan LD-endopeptidase LytH